jgi:hypothetical protein
MVPLPGCAHLRGKDGSSQRTGSRLDLKCMLRQRMGYGVFVALLQYICNRGWPAAHKKPHM